VEWKSNGGSVKSYIRIPKPRRKIKIKVTQSIWGDLLKNPDSWVFIGIGNVFYLLFCSLVEK
jgi:hypothetical protein